VAEAAICAAREEGVGVRGNGEGGDGVAGFGKDLDGFEGVRFGVPEDQGSVLGAWWERALVSLE
jgi:hypothetical protein